MTPYRHFAAHTRFPLAPLCTPAIAPRLWKLLRAAFPEALAAVIMPNHLQFVAPVADLDTEMRRLRGVLGTLTAEFHLQDPWMPVDEPTPVRDTEKLLTDVRYIHLNPCRPCDIGFHDRVRLVTDPLAWEWSTHRDVVGAVASPWVTSDRLSRAVGVHRRSFAEWFHGMVSNDRHARIGGTPFPVPVSARDLPSSGLDLIADAAAAAFRERAAGITHRGPARTTFIGLARHQGWASLPLLARAAGTSYWTARRLAATVDDTAVGAAALCLGDARLRERSVFVQDVHPPG